jgi:hypothetical protein
LVSTSNNNLQLVMIQQQVAALTASVVTQQQAIEELEIMLAAENTSLDELVDALEDCANAVEATGSLDFQGTIAPTTERNIKNVLQTGSLEEGKFSFLDFIGSASGLNGQEAAWRRINQDMIKLNTVPITEWGGDTFVEHVTGSVDDVEAVDRITEFRTDLAAKYDIIIDSVYTESIAKISAEWSRLRGLVEIDFASLQLGNRASFVSIAERLEDFGKQLDNNICDILLSVANRTTEGGRCLVAILTEARNKATLERAGIKTPNKRDVPFGDTVPLTDADRQQSDAVNRAVAIPGFISSTQLARKRLTQST